MFDIKNPILGSIDNSPKYDSIKLKIITICNEKIGFSETF